MYTDVDVKFFQDRRSSTECLQLAVLAIPTEVGDRASTKMPLTR
jgi:hypothetical protein